MEADTCSGALLVDCNVVVCYRNHDVCNSTTTFSAAFTAVDSSTVRSTACATDYKDEEAATGHS